ncbi:MAG: PFL_4669 family integrating conjugative element protein [Gammaproteobacteria bacterium]
MREAQSMHNHAYPLNSVEPSPGALRGGAVLALHSRQAARLVRGRSAQKNRPAIFGLIGFAGALRAIHDGEADQDPYAKWWLEKIRRATQRAERELRRLKASLCAAMTPDAGFSVAEVASQLPMLVELRFAASEAYAAARVLACYDRLVIEALSARHVGLIAREQADALTEQGGRAMRRLFFSPIGYRRTGVQLIDLDVDNAVARRARELMGLLPDSTVLTAVQ